MDYIKPVTKAQVYRLFNIGAVAYASASVGEDYDVMPAAWVCNLSPNVETGYGRVTAIVGRSHYTRELIDRSGYFVLSIPNITQKEQMLYLGSHSKKSTPSKINDSGIKTFTMDKFEKYPLIEGCNAWVIFKCLSKSDDMPVALDDMVVGEVVAAWADSRVFHEGHWLFESSPKEFKTMHYVAGSHLYTIGELG